MKVIVPSVTLRVRPLAAEPSVCEAGGTSLPADVTCEHKADRCHSVLLRLE